MTKQQIMPATGPNLFIVGAPKCGTTAWHRYLGEHPDIFFPAYKEPNYFLDEFPGWGRLAHYDEYLTLYEPGKGRAVRGDASPHHLYSERAADNIRHFNPDAKIIALVRDQADFFQSLLNQHIYSGVECITDPRTAWELSGSRQPADMPRHIHHPEMLDYKRLGRFDEQVERYFARFPEQNVRVFHLRDWSRNPRAMYLEILDFLGLPDDGRIEFSRVNEAHQHRF